jgi:hypothetical protein
MDSRCFGTVTERDADRLIARRHLSNFTDRARDVDGLQYIRACYYNTEIGRLLSKIPSGKTIVRCPARHRLRKPAAASFPVAGAIVVAQMIVDAIESPFC